MKIQSIIIALVPLLLTGCEMAAVVDWGADCPANSEDGKLVYIANESCSADAPDCVITDSDGKEVSYNFSKNFSLNRCPNEFPKCVQNESGTDYHCETKKDCAKGSFACELETGETRCIDPSANATCGAQEDACDAINFGGQDCSLFGLSSCVKQKDTNTYSCQCATGSKLCDNFCLNPASNETCGANDCKKENYGGDNCLKYDDVRECTKNDDDKYSCQCRQGDILCDGKCITPSSSQSNCGAKGACTESDPESKDFKGEDCDAGKGICSSGNCTCPSEQIWCSLNEEESPRCVSPHEPETCGAHLIEGTSQCEAEPCISGQSCSPTSEGLKCTQVNCEDSEILCPVDGEMKCISKLDPMNCGACNMKCENQTNGFAHGSDCKLIDDNYQCIFECNEDYTNCTPDDDLNPFCVKLKSDINNCGECGTKCSDEELCIEGVCKKTTCQPNQCERPDANGKTICDNSDTYCGPGCENCLNLSDQASCIDGTCVYGGCKSDQHPLYTGTQITGCEPNSITACAPLSNKANDPIINCNDTKPEHAAAVDCTKDGQCVVTACDANYHIAGDKKSCVANTPQSCAPNTSSDAVNCIVSPVSEAKCENGVCVVTDCAANHHLNGQKCEANSKTSCGPTNGAGKTCMADNVSDATCSAGVCVVTQCAAGFHINASKTGCVQNTNEACAPTNSASPSNCNNISNSETVSCSSTGTCQVSKCKSGHHLNSGKTACDANSDTSCAPQNSNSPVNCNSTIGNSAKTSCTSAGTCQVTNCSSGFHLNSGKTACDANSPTSCAATNSDSPTNCNNIGNSASTTCTSVGTCQVTKCSSGFHLNSGKTGCDANSNKSCAATNSNSPTNCTNISNSASTTCTSSGTCQVTKCAKNYHINSGKTGCDANSNSSCAAPDSNKPINCSSGIAKYCVSGSCKCSTDGSTVLNWNSTACVHKACQDIPGIMAGTVLTSNFYNGSDPDYACKAITCASGYEKYSQETASTCHPTSGSCPGYLGNCTPPCSYTHGCSMNSCGSGYRYYVNACLEYDVCCGTRSDWNVASYYRCTNCRAQGKTCNISSGTCQ